MSAGAESEAPAKAAVEAPMRLTAATLVPAAGWAPALVVLAAAGMAFLAVVALAAGLAAAALGEDWRRDLSGSATVRLTATDDTSLARVLDILAETEGVAGARPLAPDEQRALLAPWLGDGPILDALPVPRLVDVRLEGPGPDPVRLAARLEAAAPGTVYDNHGRWRGPLLDAAAAIERLALLAVALVGAVAAGTVALAARASLAGNAETVRIIRLIGGSDGFVARAFVRPLALRTAAGALGGAVVAAAVLLLLPGGVEGARAAGL
ncbi:MAG: cell division protein FtsX, partial [Pseudomonadota bacterium]